MSGSAVYTWDADTDADTDVELERVEAFMGLSRAPGPAPSAGPPSRAEVAAVLRCPLLNCLSPVELGEYTVEWDMLVPRVRGTAYCARHVLWYAFRVPVQRRPGGALIFGRGGARLPDDGLRGGPLALGGGLVLLHSR